MSRAAAGGWLVEWRSGSAASLHDLWPGPGQQQRRTVCVHAVTGGPALVVGSAQSDAVADAAALRSGGTVLVRRRSGGGAVLVAPQRQVWIDAWVPRDDPLWEDDVVRSGLWLGDIWAAALRAVGVPDTSVHRARATTTAWSATICFAGTGPGEVSVSGRKVVGMSQRRTASGARIQTMALIHWRPEALVSLLALSAEERRRAAEETRRSATGLRELLTDPPDDGALRRVVEEAVVAELA